MTLSAEDKAELVEVFELRRSGQRSDDAHILATVEQIAQRHIEAFKAEAVAAIDAVGQSVADADPYDDHAGGYYDAARIVRDLTP